MCPQTLQVVYIKYEQLFTSWSYLIKWLKKHSELLWSSSSICTLWILCLSHEPHISYHYYKGQCWNKLLDCVLVLYLQKAAAIQTSNVQKVSEITLEKCLCKFELYFCCLREILTVTDLYYGYWRWIIGDRWIER